MLFSTRKMIVATILVAVILALFLGFAFDSIQKVKTSVEITENEMIYPGLSKTADAILEKYAVPYVDGIALKDIGMDILLVDHQAEAACIIRDQTKYAVNYKKLDQTMVSCNQYRMIADRRETMVINCDQIMGDPVVRAITNAYQYTYASTEMLNPASIEYFPTVDQNETISFYRYGMIESAKQRYFTGAALNDFYYYYDQWAYAQGQATYQEVIHYDYYDGFRAYVRAKVLADIDPDFDLQAFITGYQNAYGIYTKDREYAVMGMLWCFLTEKRGDHVIVDPAETKNIYRKLLDGIPLGQADDEALKVQYHTSFTAYMDFIDETVERYKGDEQTKTARIPALTAETYRGTIKVDDEHFIYLEYCARENNNSLIVLDGVFVKVTPYAITLFTDAQ